MSITLGRETQSVCNFPNLLYLLLNKYSSLKYNMEKSKGILQIDFK